MYFPRIFFIILCSFSFLTLISVSIVAWQKRHLSFSKCILFLTTSAAIYALGYACELSSNSLAVIKFWLHIENIGIAFIPTAWLILALQHTSFYFRYNKILITFLLIFSSITLILSGTTDMHDLYYKSVTINTAAPFPVAKIVPGIWYDIHIVFNNVAVLLGNIFYLIYWQKSNYPQNQTALIFFLSSLFPWIITFIYTCGYIPWGLDPSPVSFLVPSIVYGWAIFSLNLFEIIPVAQKTIFETLSDTILIFDKNGILADFNKACKNIFPYINERQIGKSGLILFSHNTIMLKLIKSMPELMLEMEIKRKSRQKYQAKRINLMNGKKLIGFIITLHDITFFSNKLDTLQSKASTDPLTGIANRHKLQEDIALLLEMSPAEDMDLSLLLIDVDNFKTINDKCGHLGGDTVLKIFSRICENNLRPNDILGRYGGDEFIIILPAAAIDTALAIAEKICCSIAAKNIFMNNSLTINITASIGVAHTTNAKTPLDIKNLINHADIALYNAKKTGRNCVRIYQ